MRKEQAYALKDRVDDLIEKAREKKHEIDMGAVNWGDIDTVDVIEERSLFSGDENIYVLVEEAAPDCNLARWLTDKLNVPSVTVRTRW